MKGKTKQLIALIIIFLIIDLCFYLAILDNKKTIIYMNNYATTTPDIIK